MSKQVVEYVMLETEATIKNISKKFEKIFNTCLFSRAWNRRKRNPHINSHVTIFLRRSTKGQPRGQSRDRTRDLSRAIQEGSFEESAKGLGQDPLSKSQLVKTLNQEVNQEVSDKVYDRIDVFLLNSVSEVLFLTRMRISTEKEKSRFLLFAFFMFFDKKH